MTELDVVNDMLATMGISPLNQLDDNNPDVANCRRIINAMSSEIQSMSWWFNKELIDLFPDAVSNFVYLPGDAISCDPILREPLMPIVQRENRLYDTDKNTYTFPAGRKITCRIVRKIPFKDMPPSAQRVISIASTRKFQQSFDADPQKMARLDDEYMLSLAHLRMEHTRNISPNFLRRNSSIRSLSRINGYSNRMW